MRDLNLLGIYRRTDNQVRRHYGGVGDETCGVFDIPSLIDKAALLIVGVKWRGMGSRLCVAYQQMPELA